MKLSIITINYNNAYGLEKTISSIVKFLTSDIEYIVIDGASTDNSIDIIQKYSNKINWYSEPDSGIYNAMNKGIKHANGEYILFINSGDIIHDIQYIPSIIKDLNTTDFIYTNLKIAENDDEGYIKLYPPTLSIKYFLEDTLPHTATFIKKELFEKYGFYDENMKICSDWAFFFKLICFENCTYKHMDTCFSTFYIDGVSSKVENRQLVWKEREMFIKKELPLLYTLYIDWMERKNEMYRLKVSRSIRFIKKIGLLKWFNI